MLSTRAQKIKTSFPPKPAGFAGDLESILAGRRAWDEQCEPIGPGVFREDQTRPFYYLIHPAFVNVAILYAHGGGFTEGSARTHQHLCKAISKAAHACVYNVEYSLAPEATYPVAVDEFCELYRRVREKHAAIYFVGDSAGACLVMQAMLKLMSSGETEKINGIALISPWLDLDVEKHKHSPRDGADPLVTYDALKGCADLYLAGTDATDPAISPSFAKNQLFPPTLILVGSDEILLDDALELYENNKTTSQIELAIYEDMWHVWPGWLDLEESQRAIKQIGDFVKQHIERN
jgi:acetyl esterase/lipase